MPAKFRSLKTCVFGMVAAVTLLTPSAFAADPIGTITSITTPNGSVLVQRGAKIYSLKTGDQIFEGDQIVTRGNGSVSFTDSGCTPSARSLGGLQSVNISAGVCNQIQTALTEQATASGGATIGSGVVGATPLLIIPAALLASLASGGGGTSASP